MSSQIAFTQENETLAKLYLVSDEGDDITPYLVERLEQWLEVKGNTLDLAAKIGGVSKTQLSNLKTGSRGAGRKTVRALIRVLGTSLYQVELDAKAHGARRRELAPAQPQKLLPQSFVELQPRYPHLADAIRIRSADWLPETQRDMAKQADHAPTDRSTGSWLDEGDVLDKQRRKGLPPGRPLDVEDDTPPAGR